ncbi:DinB family protein [Flavobacterium sp. D11R37]|uniref:DinB family protein n=1 Tax=Flavobacterium coralii TaxID=2838017 RepID=UPI001CA63FED|nr:DinB family protein [Flavobacterium coralii]MBY8961310.1 DinB family protein [Flavobacterium coralii]
MLFQSVTHNLSQLSVLLQQMTDEFYTMPVTELGGASVGEHIRHIIELYECLLSRYDEGVVNYDDRKRDKTLQSSKTAASDRIDVVSVALLKQNKKLILRQMVGGSIMEFESNYYRELLYNFDHTIHHQALIKVALINIKDIAISEDFGVAPSTLEYRKNVHG